MDILIENLFNNQQILEVPGFLVRSTAPSNVEDEVSNVIDQDQPTIQTVVERLYRSSQTETDLGIVIAIHGYNTGVDSTGRDGVLEGWYQPLCTFINQDPVIRKTAKSHTFLGYRWPSESLKKKGIRKEALKALPVLLGVLLYGGLATALISLIFLILTKQIILATLIILGILPFAVIVSLFLLRISLYFRDSYRATYFGVPDLVELIRQLDQGLVQCRVSDVLTEDVLYDRIASRTPGMESIAKPEFFQLIQTISHELGKHPDLELDLNDRAFQRFLKQLKHKISSQVKDETLLQIIQRLVLIESLENDAAQRYWQKHSIKLSFIGHSMGGHVTTQVIRILSDIFDPRSVGAIDAAQGTKNPSSNVGRVFKLGRLILVSPDIPVLTITSGRSNFLRSALRRFEEAYLFSNEGDLALRIASTAANYFSFPAKSRTQGYRLGNVTVCPRNRSTIKSKSHAQACGILNLNELSSLQGDLLEYLEINILNQDQNQKLDPASQRLKRDEPVASKDEDQESIADLFTYFDCTEYRDRTDYNPTAQTVDANLMVLDGQRSPLKFFDYIRLFIAFVTFSPKNFPKGGRDVHGGYFAGDFCKLLMYRIAFLGLQKFLDTLILVSPAELHIHTPIPEPLNTDLAAAQLLIPQLSSIDSTTDPTLENHQLMHRQTIRKTALNYLSWILEQKRIQSVLSPERYQVDLLGRDRQDVREGILTQRI